MKNLHALCLEVEEEEGGESKNPATLMSALGITYN